MVGPVVSLLLRGDILLFALITVALIVSLTFHEYAHAAVAKLSGDRTAELAGRLTLNPLAHIDPMGLLMVVLVGFGYARPVPVDPRYLRSPRADLWIAAAGPAMNLLLAALVWNGFLALRGAGVAFVFLPGPETFVVLLVRINLILMLFNLIPLGPLDGHWILPHLLPEAAARWYRYYNARYGQYALFGLILLSIAGVPVFRILMTIGARLVRLITFV